jgi:hypothetical protein
MRTIVILFVVMIPLMSFAATVEEIVRDPLHYDNTKVSVRGEVIGERLIDRDGSWVNISWGGYNLGVFLPGQSVWPELKNFGSYKSKGDIVTIQGTFYARCPQHAQRGIHASRLEVVERGGPSRDEVDELKVFLSFVLAILCLLLGIIYLIKEKIWKKKLRK